MRLQKSSGLLKRLKNRASWFVIRQVRGGSMEPALKPGQLVVGYRTRSLRVGDMVIIRHGGLEKIKRIARQRNAAVYLLGDNAAASTDSQHFGWLSAAEVVARVVWPRR